MVNDSRNGGDEFGLTDGDRAGGGLLPLLADSYKYSHWRQYPPDTNRVYSYLEARGGGSHNAEFPCYPGTEVVFFGLQYLLRRYLAGNAVQYRDIFYARNLIDAHMGARPGLFNLDGFKHILRDHNGRLPLVIRAVPEGTPVPLRNVLMTVENTCDQCFWLTSFVETLLVQVWYACTVATLSREVKRVLMAAAVESGTPALVRYRLHDFGCRGVSSMESAMIGGMAHLVNFVGTDTVPALLGPRDHYGEPHAVHGYSIPAMEHSTVTAWRRSGEAAAYANMLDQYPTGLVACVSDSYDIMEACGNIWGKELHDRVVNRPGTVVIRPDTGDPEKQLPAILDLLGRKFGIEINAKGYRLLHPSVRVIWGDGMNYYSLRSVVEKLVGLGWSIDNVAFGMGGGLLQKLNRDTLGFAYKTSWVRVGKHGWAVSKSPADGSKVSKAGRMALVRHPAFHGGSPEQAQESGQWATVVTNEDGARPTYPDELVEVFRDGEMTKEWTFSEVRARAKLHDEE